MCVSPSVSSQWGIQYKQVEKNSQIVASISKTTQNTDGYQSGKTLDNSGYAQ